MPGADALDQMCSVSSSGMRNILVWIPDTDAPSS
jgi:hypothetical protein